MHIFSGFQPIFWPQIKECILTWANLVKIVLFYHAFQDNLDRQQKSTLKLLSFFPKNKDIEAHFGQNLRTSKNAKIPKT